MDCKLLLVIVAVVVVSLHWGNAAKKYSYDLSYKNKSSVSGEWADMEERYPYRRSNYTYLGATHLVLSLHLRSWDIQNVTKLSEQEEQRFVRYVSARMMEDMHRHTIPNAKGAGFKKFDIVINLEGFSLETHACLQCVRLQLEIMEKVGSQWSHAVDTIFLANAPDFPEHVYSWIDEFKERFEVLVKIRPGKVLLRNTKDGMATSVVVFQDWVWPIVENARDVVTDEFNVWG